MSTVEELSKKKIENFHSISTLIYAYIHLNYFADREELEKEEIDELLLSEEVIENIKNIQKELWEKDSETKNIYANHIIILNQKILELGGTLDDADINERFQKNNKQK